MNEINPDNYCEPECASQGAFCEQSGTVAVNENPNSILVPRAATPRRLCENRTLCILGELNRIYEERLTDIDEQAKGSHELKYLTYKEWVEMLLKLMKDLIDVVQELEYEAINRIELLETKLLSEKNTSCSTNNDIVQLQSDVCNLVELIRRALVEGVWNVDGLAFSTIKIEDMFGPSMDVTDSLCGVTKSPSNVQRGEVDKLKSLIISKSHAIKKLDSDNQTLRTDVQRKDLLIKEYSTKIRELETYCMRSTKDKKRNFICEQEESINATEEDAIFNECIAELKKCLKVTESQLADKLKENECLQSELRLYKTQAAQKDKAIANMRALAFEVADKHDQIIQMRDQLNSLEEELKRAHKKVQFKDNVIRELRREIKNSPKNERACQCLNSGRVDSDTEKQSFKSVLFNDFESSHRSQYTMDQIMDPELIRIGNSVRDTEDRCIATLKDELEKLLRYQSTYTEAMDDQKRNMAAQQERLREIVSKMFADLSKCRRKLSFMRARLMAISEGSGVVSRMSPKQEDSGYISPEDMEPENHIIATLGYQMNAMRNENEHLKEQLRNLGNDMLSGNGSVCDRCQNCANNEKLLQDMSNALSNCGKPIVSEPCDGTVDGDRSELHPICQAVINLQKELSEKNHNIRCSQKMLAEQDSEIKSLQQELYKFQQESNSKNCQIEELQRAVQVHNNSIECLQTAKCNLEMELGHFKKMTDEETDYKKLIKSKEKLELECQNQLTTINNLRQALEDLKKTRNSQTGHSSPVICTDVDHEVLSDQVEELFIESVRLERMLLQIRDENLSLKELLVDTECDFQQLERKYVNISRKLYFNPHQEFQILNARSQQLRQEIEIRGGQQLYINCFRNIREKMEKECQRRLQSQEIKYREIINDLSNELTSLSNQVQETQNELNRNEFPDFEASMRQLQAQNEMLQRTIEGLERKIASYDDSLTKSKMENHQLQAQVAQSRCILKEKDAKYRELSDQYQLLARTLNSQSSNCSCGAIGVIYSVVAEARRIAVILANEKHDDYPPRSHAGAEQQAGNAYEMEEQVRQMQVRIDLLEKTLEKREQDLREMQTRLLQNAQQNGELTTELFTAQDQLFYLQAEDERLRGVVDRMNSEIMELRNSRRERESNLMGELNRVRQTMDQHVNALSNANDTITLLERQMHNYRRQGDDANKENAMLKAELYKVKESLATQDGVEKSLREQLLQCQSEITLLKCDLERFTCLFQDIENLKKHCSRLKDANFDLVKKYNDLVEDYNRLEEEYRKLVDIKDELFTEVENGRQWQAKQKEQDKIIASKFRKLEEHIDTLLDDRKKLICKISELHRDTILISGELEHFKDICSGSLRSTQLFEKFDELHENYHKLVQFGKKVFDVLPTDNK